MKCYKILKIEKMLVFDILILLFPSLPFPPRGGNSPLVKNLWSKLYDKQRAGHNTNNVWSGHRPFAAYTTQQQGVVGPTGQ